MGPTAFKAIIAGLLIIGFINLCSSGDDDPSVTQQVNIYQMTPAAEGLDLKAVGALVKEVSSAEELEKKLNDPNVGVNNLDLDQDKNVDFLKVTEYGDKENRGFSLTVDMPGGETQEVADIQFAKTEEGKAEMQVSGNQSIYGANHTYSSGLSPGGFMWGYLFGSMMSRPFYASPY